MNEIKLIILQQFSDFLPLKPDWEELYNIDPQAQVFLSWPWMVNILNNTEYQWFVVALYIPLPRKYIAFFPLTRMKSQNRFLKILKTAGTPYIDHTGILCHPDYEEAVICILAEFLDRWPYWDKIYAWDIFDSRLVKILKQIIDDADQKKICLEEEKPTPCPFITLPSSWEIYENHFLNANSKYNYARKRKKLSNLDGFVSFTATQANLNFGIETLLTLWGNRFEIKKPEIFRNFLLNFKEPAMVDLLVMQTQGAPVAAACGFIDSKKSAYSLYLIGHNESFSQYSPGKLIILNCIQNAIENHCRYFDFLRGSHDFKYSFGAVDRFNQNIIISRRRVPNPLRKSSTPEYSSQFTI